MSEREEEKAFPSLVWGGLAVAPVSILLAGLKLMTLVLLCSVPTPRERWRRARRPQRCQMSFHTPEEVDGATLSVPWCQGNPCLAEFDPLL